MNMTDYEFSDDIAHITCTNADEDHITIKTNGAEWVFFTKEDVENMMKHFNNYTK